MNKQAFTENIAKINRLIIMLKKISERDERTLLQTVHRFNFISKTA